MDTHERLLGTWSSSLTESGLDVTFVSGTVRGEEKEVKGCQHLGLKDKRYFHHVRLTPLGRPIPCRFASRCGKNRGACWSWKSARSTRWKGKKEMREISVVRDSCRSRARQISASTSTCPLTSCFQRKLEVAIPRIQHVLRLQRVLQLLGCPNGLDEQRRRKRRLGQREI